MGTKLVIVVGNVIFCNHIRLVLKYLLTVLNVSKLANQQSVILLEREPWISAWVIKQCTDTYLNEY